MKLLYCKTCGDVVRLTYDVRTCVCTDCSGRYTDDVMAKVRGPCLVIGFHNPEFYDAVHADLDKAKKGVEFLAFMIPNNAASIERVDDGPN